MEKEKYVDESWKEQASQEKEILNETSQPQSEQDNEAVTESSLEATDQDLDQSQDSDVDAGQEQTVEVNFLNYITSFGFQAMIFMGEIPNPVSNKTERNLMQAKFLVDTLAMLKEKTTGNLSDQERDLLENTVYELQMKYVQISQNGGAPEGGTSA